MLRRASAAARGFDIDRLFRFDGADAALLYDEHHDCCLLMMIVIYLVKTNQRAEGSRHMKVSRVQAAENQARVIEVAGRLFREKGFDGGGAADIMKGAGLTRGGFYGQFASKYDLAPHAFAQT